MFLTFVVSLFPPLNNFILRAHTVFYVCAKTWITVVLLDSSVICGAFKAVLGVRY